MRLSDLTRTLRTVRHLRPSQIAWRLRYRLQKKRPAAVPHLPETLTVRDDFPDLPQVFHQPGLTGRDALEALERGDFEHLHVSRHLGREETDWLTDEKTHDRLWTITLHYHAWAWELADLARGNDDSSERADALLRHYLADWITRCNLTLPGSRELAWNAYAVATRIGWWCRLYHTLGNSGRRHWGPLESTFLRSLWSQAAYLHEHLEFDLLANHLLRDAVGLAWAGRFFQGSQPQRWLDTATRLAVEQAEEQVLADGGHFERSPMYHVQVMEDLLCLALLLEDEPARACLRETWQRMAEFLAWTRHPDGQVPLLNDGGFNGACPAEIMLQAGGPALGEAVEATPRGGGKFFCDFGLLVWHGEPWSVFFDVGPPGADYQGGHVHADSLSLEASYAGHRLFVDPGTFHYDRDDRRRYDRATASHNTLCIDDTDSSEVWHVFRLGRRARPIGVEVNLEADGCEASAAHTGYDHLGGRPRHRRTLRVTDQGPLTVVDRIDGSGTHVIEGGLLIAPGWQVREAPDGWILTRGTHMLAVFLEAAGLERSTPQRPYHCEYGRDDMCPRLVWRGVLQLPGKMVLRVEPYRRNPIEVV